MHSDSDGSGSPREAHLARHKRSALSRRALLVGCGATASQILLAGCGDVSRVNPLLLPPNPQPTPAGSTTPVSVTVTRTTVGAIPPSFAGLSYDKLSMNLPRFNARNTNLINLFRLLGSSLLRIGGYSVDFVQWAPNGLGQTTGEVAPSDIDALAAFLEAADWDCLYSVNLAKSTPAAAAAEVLYAARSLGRRLVGVELGNECNLYGTYRYFNDWNLQIFEQLWEEYRNAILQSAPNVAMTGPAAIGNIGSWTVPFAQQLGGQISLLTQHYYRASGRDPGSTAAKLISPDPTLIANLAQLKAAAAASGIPFRMSETNSYYAGGAIGVSDSYASSLWVIDYLFNVALGGGAGVNLTGGGDTGGYTPIADDNGAVQQARPEYYGALFFTLAGAGSLFDTSVSASGLNVTAYSVARADAAGISVVVVNKELSQNLKVTVDCGGPVSSASVISMEGASLEATSGVRIQSSTVATDGSFNPKAPYTLPVSGNAVSCYLQPLSSALISLV